MAEEWFAGEVCFAEGNAEDTRRFSLQLGFKAVSLVVEEMFRGGGLFRGGYAEGIQRIRGGWFSVQGLFKAYSVYDVFVLIVGMEKSENKLVYETVGFAMKIHSRFGPGLLESAYRECLAYELRKSGLKVDVEKTLPLIYEEVRLNHGYRIDMLINDMLVVELKSVDRLLDVHFAQLLTYLKVGDYRLGLMLNFKVAHLKDGIRRVANKL